MENDKLTHVLGIVGTVIAVLMFVSLLEIARNNIFGNTNIVIQPIVTTVNCTVWSLYAHLKKERYVFWANFPGIILGLFTVITAFMR
ncbi:MAG: Small membrane protein [Candidatus Yanofskybacteria bacterium GW2011_GWA1_48_10]|uniref:Small membrane protein n=2 Tax=Parcubacteria group TaxID=1794811 RepID=A0A0G1U6C6_9BACT|nr:MAG: Small membrane protein [Candidatus Nomurabacteria bacterium GW2011_GWB1_47_6]KKU89594.1 MAG: Small membrane protein [Candidatus Yanofskybacteria bacterium GW2011_GWA1_48_10]